MNTTVVRTFIFTLAALLTACPGPDYTPVYFPPAESGAAPAPSGGEEPPSDRPALEVTKLIVDESGKEIGVPIPNGTEMEISTGTFIATAPTDIGPRFEASAKFRVVNASRETITYTLPPTVGPFLFQSIAGLNQSLPPNGMFLLRVTFRPERGTVKTEGRVTHALSIGADTFTLAATALEPRGRAVIDLLGPTGNVLRENIDTALIGAVAVPAAARRAYFQCGIATCAGTPLPTACQPCVDIARGHCQLLTIGNDGNPIDAVTTECRPAYPKEREELLINFGGEGMGTPTPTTQLFAVRNSGTKPLTLTALTIKELVDSQSPAQFTLGGATNIGTVPISLPIVLPPYEPPLITTRAFFAVSYSPTDLTGSDGKRAGIGTAVTDQAELDIATDGIDARCALKGITALKDVPPLQVLLRTATGVKDRAEGQPFAFRGVTMATTDLAVPLYIRATESAGRTIRIVAVTLAGPDAEHFEWLDTPAEILAKPEGARCVQPVFDPTTGDQVSVIADLQPVGIVPNGYDLKPGAHTLATAPLFGCVNFHRESDDPGDVRRQFAATLTIVAHQLGADRHPIRNPDGTVKQSEFRIPLAAVINPRQGKMVLRLTQTMAAMMNPQFPTLAAISSKKEIDILIAAGLAKPEDGFIFLGSLILDPFDEETITNEAGIILTKPGDGITGIFRAIDTQPSADRYEDPFLPDFVNLAFDAARPAGARGIFFDYPNVPPTFRTGSLRLFTGSLSYPGPVAAPEERPDQPSQCEIVNPCSPEGQRKYGVGPSEAGKKGVCAFFFASAGAYQSPAFHTPSSLAGGERQDLCQLAGSVQAIDDWRGSVTLDGALTFAEGAIRFWGPTYFHNPNGLLGPMPPLDEVLRLTLTTEALLPQSETPGHNFLPDARINTAKQEHKINLNDPALETPPLCPNNTRNRPFAGRRYSTWRYIAPFLVKDTKGETPAGCPEEGSSFTGGSAFLRGRRLDHATGILSVVGAAKFSANDNLTFAFKDMMTFLVLNGWLCDPLGRPEEFEGERCFDHGLNERDARSEISIVDGERDE